MKLFTKDIDKKLFSQYSKGADLENQKVVAKIFNPYGRGRWYLLNSDPNDPDYIWAIVQMDDDIDVGSVSRKELENIKVPPFRLGLERDIYFSEVNAAELFKGLFSGKFYKSGGEVDIAEQNKDMLINYAEELEHHTEEFEEAAKKAENVEPWVVAKIERSTTDLSDVTHYLDSENEKRREYGNGEGEEMAKGGETKVEDVVYIQYRNAKKKFAIDKKYFRGDDAYMDAVKWGRKNIPNFNMDMVKFEMEKGAELDFGDFYEWSNKEVKKKFGSSFDEGFPIVKFVKDSGDKKVESASGVLKNGKNVVFDVEEVQWEQYGKMAKGGVMADSSDVLPKIGSEVRARWNDTMQWTLGTFKGETENGFEVYDFTIEKPKYIEYYSQISIDPYNGTKIFKSDKFKDRNYKNYHFKKEEMFDDYAKGGLINIGTNTKTDSDVYYDRNTKSFYLYVIDGAGSRINKIEANSIDDVLKKYPNWKWSEVGRKEFESEKGKMAKGGEVAKVGEPYDSMSKYQLEKEYKKLNEKRDSLKNKYGSFDSQEISENEKEIEKIITLLYGEDFSGKGQKFKYAKGGLIDEIKQFEKYNYPKPKTKGERVRAIFEYLSKKGYSVEEINRALSEMKYAKGGVTFADKVKSIKSSLLKRKKVSPKVQKDYGKTYSPSEAEDSAKRIVGAMTAKERLMKRMKKGKK